MAKPLIQRRRKLRLFALISLCMLILTTGLQFFTTKAEAAQAQLVQGKATSPVKATATVYIGATPRSTAVTQASASLNHEPTGTVHLTYNASAKSLNVNATVNGLAPNSTHTIQIQQGSCTNAKPGTTRYTLPPLKADVNGHATVNTTINNIVGGIPASGLSINVFNASKAQPGQAQVSIACKDINNANKNSDLTFSLGPSAAPSENSTGKVQLNVQNGNMTVQVNAKGLAANSTHAAVVRAGTCQKPGNVLYNLNGIKADAQGSINKSVTFKGVSSIPTGNMAVFVYSGAAAPTSANQSNNDPIMCGNVRVAS